ncbi:hypothetical protein MtrunA17_Chr7g0227011 [Medicago truncatula]|uniref:Uncharacterized protein n=1 Tax=Medicago truncatula TaxID=3880 RepID=A0A396H0B6_MEDTR|nr:hypothetical protein MtrunA17_Chr7g0227011 [Medicago truncatula]
MVEIDIIPPLVETSRKRIQMGLRPPPMETSRNRIQIQLLMKY